MSDVLEDRLNRLADEWELMDLVDGGWTHVVERASTLRPDERGKRERRRWSIAIATVAASALAITAATWVWHSPDAATKRHPAGPLHTVEYRYVQGIQQRDPADISDVRYQVDYVHRRARLVVIEHTREAPYTQSSEPMIATPSYEYYAVSPERRKHTQGKAWFRIPATNDWDIRFGLVVPQLRTPLAELRRRPGVRVATIGSEVMRGRSALHLRGTVAVEDMSETTDLWIDDAGRLLRKEFRFGKVGQPDPAYEEITVTRWNPSLSIALPRPEDTLSLPDGNAADRLFQNAIPPVTTATRTKALDGFATFLSSWMKDGYRAAAKRYLDPGLELTKATTAPTLLNAKVIRSRMARSESENDFLLVISVDLRFGPGYRFDWKQGRNEWWVHFTRRAPDEPFRMMISSTE